MATTEELLTEKRERIDLLHRCRPGRSALLIVDMQRAFLEQGALLEVPRGREIVPNIARLIEICRRHTVPIIFTEFVYSVTVPCLRGDPFGPEHLPAESDEPTGFGRPSSNCLIGLQPGQGPESAATVDALAPLPEELVIQAHTYDKFFGTPLELALRSHHVDRLLVTGVTTDVCVNATVLAAATRNYLVTVASDGVATIDQEIHQACLKIWQNKFARVKTTDELIEELDAVWGTTRESGKRPMKHVTAGRTRTVAIPNGKFEVSFRHKNPSGNRIIEEDEFTLALTGGKKEHTIRIPIAHNLKGGPP